VAASRFVAAVPERGRRSGGASEADPARLPRIFVLSPADCAGARAARLASGRSDLAERLRRGEATVGEVFARLSGLYFRGKLAYARAFARPPDPAAPLSGSGVLVVTSRAGLVPASAPLTPVRLRALGRARIDPAHRRYRAPLERSARVVAEEIGERTEVVLLGSVATEKYTAVLSAVFGERLVVPAALVGRGGAKPRRAPARRRGRRRGAAVRADRVRLRAADRAARIGGGGPTARRGRCRLPSLRHEQRDGTVVEHLA
jgi:hypothetical protein